MNKEINGAINMVSSRFYRSNEQIVNNQFIGHQINKTWLCYYF